MSMDLGRVGATAPVSRITWAPEDAALYALAVGAGVDQPSFTVTAGPGGRQLVYPTFVLAAVLAEASARWPDPALQTGSYRIDQLVLGEQSLRLHAPIPPSGDVEVRTVVAGIDDKGSGALVRLDSTAIDARTRGSMFTATTGVFVIGAGGFGGDRGPATTAPKPPDRAPNVRLWSATLPSQTLWYRYAGHDRNPIHVDPAVAIAAGYRAPILMGQNTLGFACRMLVDSICGGDPTVLSSISGRFAAPGYNGDVLAVEAWLGADVGLDGEGREAIVFRVVNQAQDVLVDRGHATLR